MASSDQLRAAIKAHVAAVGAADAAALAALYAPTAGCTTGPAVSPSWAAPRSPITSSAACSANPGGEIVTIAVIGHDAAVLFRATPAGGETRDVIDTRPSTARR